MFYYTISTYNILLIFLTHLFHLRHLFYTPKSVPIFILKGIEVVYEMNWTFSPHSFQRTRNVGARFLTTW